MAVDLVVVVLSASTPCLLFLLLLAMVFLSNHANDWMCLFVNENARAKPCAIRNSLNKIKTIMSATLSILCNPTHTHTHTE